MSVEVLVGCAPLHFARCWVAGRRGSLARSAHVADARSSSAGIRRCGSEETRCGGGDAKMIVSILMLKIVDMVS
jgi:hypothetical protein